MTAATYDLKFAHAVRLAASGIRPKARVDPATEGAMLADYLRSKADLDRQGLDLLADLVTGKLRKLRKGSNPRSETVLSQAVRCAGEAWRNAKGADPATTGINLAGMLLDDDRQIGEGERYLLADLITGEMRRGNGRPPKGAGHSSIVAAVEISRELIAGGEGRRRAMHSAGGPFNVTDWTVAKYEAMVKAREQQEDEK